MAGAGTMRRLLVVVDDACTTGSRCAAVLRDPDGAPLEVFVVSPARGAATQWYADDDAATADATRRLRACVGCLRRQGIDALGALIRPDPVQGIADALQLFPADRIRIVSARRRPSTWLRPGVVDRLRRTFTQPIEHVVVPATRERSFP